MKVVWHFLRGFVVRVAVRLESGDTSAVLVPLVFPETFCRIESTGPILVHIVKKLVITRGFQNVRDAWIFPFRITICLVCAIAVIRLKGISAPLHRTIHLQ